MLEPVTHRWAWSACLVAIAFLAVQASASLDPETSQAESEVREASGDVDRYAAGTAGQAAALAAEAEAGVQKEIGSLVPEQEPAPEEEPAPSGPSGTPSGRHAPRGSGGLVPAQPLPLDQVMPVLDPVRKLLPEDPVGLARSTAEDAAQLPDSLLKPAPASDDEAAAPATSTAVEQGPSALMAGAAILVAAGAATAATFFGFWLAGSSGAVGTKAATAAASRVGDLRRLLPFASPLFTRFERDTVLGHPRREALYALILQEPGISLQALGDASGLSRTAVIHHLRLLEQQHLVVSRRVGRSRHYFENGGRYGHDQKEAYAVLQNDRSKAVAEYIKGHPGAMQKSLCEALGIQPSIAHWHVRRLEEAKVVETVRQGRTVAYFPGPGLQAMRAADVAAPITPSGPASAAPA